MKKMTMAICCATLALASFADPGCADGKCSDPSARPPCGREQMHRRPMTPPLQLTVDQKTSPEEIEAYKKSVLEKIDEAVFKQKEGGENRPPLKMTFIVGGRPKGPGRGGDMHGKRRGPKDGGRKPRRPGFGDGPVEGGEGRETPPAPPAE